MTRTTLPPQLRTFLNERVRGFEDIEILLMLRHNTQHPWTPEDVSERLDIDLERARDSLDELCRGGLLDVQVGPQSLLFRYSPATPELRALSDQLLEAYDKNRIETIRLINANALERVRNQALRAFSDAFVLGGRKKDG